MAATGKREYNVIINGISKSIKDTTSLYDAFQKLNAEIEKTNKSNLDLFARSEKSSKATKEATRVTKESTKALTDEEKAAKKLAETELKVQQVKSGLTKEQVSATMALREANKEISLQVKEQQAAEGSIVSMRTQLSRLTAEWGKLDMKSERFQAVSNEINELTGRLNTAEQSIGNFKRNVGNYSSAFNGLGISINQVMRELPNFAMSAQTGILALSNNIPILADQIEMLRVKNEALQKAGKPTESILKAIASSVLSWQTAMVLGITVLTMYGKEIGEFVKALFKGESAINAIAKSKERLKNIGIESIEESIEERANLQLLYRTTQDTSRSIEERTSAVRQLKREYPGHLKNLSDEEILAGKGKEAYDKLTKSLIDNAKARIVSRAYKENEVEIMGELIKIYKWEKQIEDIRNRAATNATGAVPFQGRYVAAAEAIADINKQIAVHNKRIEEYQKNAEDIAKKFTVDATNYAEEEEEASKRAAEAAEAAAEKRLRIARETADNRLAILEESREKERIILATSLQREVEDAEAQAGKMSALAISYREKEANELAKFDEETVRLIEQKRTDIRLETEEKGSDEYLRARHEQLTRQYDAELEEANRLGMDLTEVDRKYAALRAGIEEEFVNEKIAKNSGLYTKTLSNIVDDFRDMRKEIGNVLVRDVDGLELIDVEATQANLSQLNNLETGYIEVLQNYLENLTNVHEQSLSVLVEGTPEYEEQMSRYTSATIEAESQITQAQQRINENQKKSADVVSEYFEDLFGKISKYAGILSDSISAGVEAASMVLQAQLDALNETLDKVNEKYDKAKEQSESAAEHVEKIEEKMQNATGRTTEALKTQLQDAMHARGEANREEQRLAREKERLEEQIAKKEKQLKRANLVSDIAQGIAQTASAVIGALGNHPWGPWNIAMAAVVGAMGAAQTAIMTRQLVKLEDGGLITGPSHANGGVPILGTNIEVEGGEYVVNKASYAANEDLVKFINASPGRAITAADLAGIVPENTVPFIVTDSGQLDGDRIIEAIRGINMRPVVSVTDIQNVSDTVVAVRDMAGFGS